MIVAWHNVVGLGEINHIIVEIIHPSKTIYLLAHRGLCLPCDGILPCCFSFGCVIGKLILKAIE